MRSAAKELARTADCGASATIHNSHVAPIKSGLFPLTPISAHVIPCMPSPRRPAPFVGQSQRETCGLGQYDSAVGQVLGRVGVRWGSSNGMDRFVSTYINKIDAKGRVSVPASFRTILERDGYAGGIYCYPSLDAPALDAGGKRLAENIDRILDGLPDYSDERDELSVALYGDVVTLTIDQDGRIVLPEALRAHAGISTHIAFVGLGQKFQMWEPARFEARRASAREKVPRPPQTVRRGAPPLGGGRRGRSTGMTARSGTPSAEGARRGTLRHIPVLLPEVLAALAPQAGQTFIDGTFGAGGYTSALLDARRGVRSSRHRPRSGCDCGGQALVGASDGRLTLVEGTFGDLDGIAEDERLCAGRRRRARHRRVVDAARRARARLLVPERRPARHAHGQAGRRRPTSSTRRRRADLADIFFHLGEERRSRARGAGHRRRGAASSPFTRTSELAELAERVLGRAEDRRPACGDAHLPGAAHLRQRRAGRAGAGPRGGRARAQARRAAGGRDLPLARGRHGQAFLRHAGRRSKARARATCRRAARRSLRQASTSTVRRPSRPARQEIDANPRARSAKLRGRDAHGGAGLAGGCRPRNSAAGAGFERPKLNGVTVHRLTPHPTGTISTQRAAHAKQPGLRRNETARCWPARRSLSPPAFGRGRYRRHDG